MPALVLFSLSPISLPNPRFPFLCKPSTSTKRTRMMSSPSASTLSLQMSANSKMAGKSDRSLVWFLCYKNINSTSCDDNPCNFTILKVIGHSHDVQTHFYPTVSKDICSHNLIFCFRWKGDYNGQVNLWFPANHVEEIEPQKKVSMLDSYLFLSLDPSS